MNQYRNFCLVVLVQFVIAAALLMFRHISPRQATSILWRSALLGIPLGLAYDLLIGEYHAIFAYYPTSSEWLFYPLNSIFSYGLAIATAWIIPERLPETRNPIPGVVLTPVVIVSTLGLFVLPLIRLPIVAEMFVAGSLVLIISETSASFVRFDGVFLSALRGNWLPSLRVWLISVLLGSVYEFANSQFPVWRWQPLPGFSHAAQVIMIVGLGYTVLFYPLFVATRILPRSLNPIALPQAAPLRARQTAGH